MPRVGVHFANEVTLNELTGAPKGKAGAGPADAPRLVLGIDPGTATMGYGLVRHAGGDLSLIDCGVLTTSAGQPLPTRLQSLYNGLMRLIAQHRPHEMAIEQLFVRGSFTAAQAVYQARGVALLAAANSGLPVAEYTPLQVKLAVARYGRATKEQIQEMVRALLGLEDIPEPDDAADAVAIAVCHLYTGEGHLYTGEGHSYTGEGH